MEGKAWRFLLFGRRWGGKELVIATGCPSHILAQLFSNYLFLVEWADQIHTVMQNEHV